jgi:hypothetical protein
MTSEAVPLTSPIHERSWPGSWWGVLDAFYADTRWRLTAGHGTAQALAPLPTVINEGTPQEEVIATLEAIGDDLTVANIGPAWLYPGCPIWLVNPARLARANHEPYRAAVFPRLNADPWIHLTLPVGDDTTTPPTMTGWLANHLELTQRESAPLGNWDLSIGTCTDQNGQQMPKLAGQRIEGQYSIPYNNMEANVTCQASLRVRATVDQYRYQIVPAVHDWSGPEIFYPAGIHTEPHQTANHDGTDYARDFAFGGTLRIRSTRYPVAPVTLDGFPDADLISAEIFATLGGIYPVGSGWWYDSASLTI